MRHGWIQWSLVTAVLFLSAVVDAGADVVELKNGQRVEGTFQQATPSGIVIEVGGQRIVFKQGQVRAIYFGSAPPSSSSAAPVTSAQPSAAQDALKALRGLQSVTTSGISYREYAPRVSDAKITVDQYLREPGGDPEAKKAIATTMGYHVLASSVWNVEVSERNASDRANRLSRLLQQPIVKTCSDLTPVTGAPGVPTIWECASAKLADAERLLDSSGR
jgi:hypothetical protein